MCEKKCLQYTHVVSREQPNRPDEKRRVENAGGRVDESTNTVDGVLPTSRAFGMYTTKIKAG
jgi:hypothetical protein